VNEKKGHSGFDRDVEKQFLENEPSRHGNDKRLAKTDLWTLGEHSVNDNEASDPDRHSMARAEFGKELSAQFLEYPSLDARAVPSQRERVSPTDFHR